MATQSFPRDPKRASLFTEVPLRNGYKVLGPCRLETLVGQGGMGVVYRGTHLRLRIPVAVKCVLPELLDGETLLDKRLWHEAQIAASINHPNLVRVFDCGVAHGIPFLIMEFVEGETLQDRVRRDGPLDVATAVRLLAGTAEGVGAAHALGKIHRDLKPSNIIIDRADNPKVADFGVAKDIGGGNTKLTKSGQGLGTPNYMPIEQWQEARTVEPSADVYSLGATLYFALAGECGVDGPSLPEILTQLTTKGHPDIRDRRPDVPADLARVINRAVRKTPRRRFADANQLVAALHGLDLIGTKDRRVRSLLRPTSSAVAAPSVVPEPAAPEPAPAADEQADELPTAPPSSVYVEQSGAATRLIEWVGLVVAVAVLLVAVGFFTDWGPFGDTTEAAPPGTSAEQARSRPVDQDSAERASVALVGTQPPTTEPTATIEQPEAPQASGPAGDDAAGDDAGSDEEEVDDSASEADLAADLPATTDPDLGAGEPAVETPEQRAARIVLEHPELERVPDDSQRFLLKRDRSVELVLVDRERFSFLIGVTEVTNGQFERFVLDAGEGALRPGTQSFYGEGGTADYYGERPNHPVVNVNLASARAYCDWAGGGGDLTLPTVEHWWAVVGGTSAPAFPWGEDDWPGEGLCVMGRSFLDGPGQAGADGRWRSDEGVVDLIGNVAEWVEIDDGDGASIGGDFRSVTADRSALMRPTRRKPADGPSDSLGFRVALPLDY